MKHELSTMNDDPENSTDSSSIPPFAPPATSTPTTPNTTNTSDSSNSPSVFMNSSEETDETNSENNDLQLRKEPSAPVRFCRELKRLQESFTSTILTPKNPTRRQKEEREEELPLQQVKNEWDDVSL